MGIKKAADATVHPIRIFRTSILTTVFLQQWHKNSAYVAFVSSDIFWVFRDGNKCLGIGKLEEVREQIYVRLVLLLKRRKGSELCSSLT